ncbi:FAD/NAD(P)-binding protein [Pseudoclavibacter sp. 13-3]|uniref:FAD/NAD(P)-binding protein n=1 Tax=Pseudoclavibacter sp. 13-3 TaxID=2901228 RepID=UPI001E5B3328|nr:FAD/NAD(P)-binding protein [Pseudoclavibacter sp. 13-3]
MLTTNSPSPVTPVETRPTATSRSSIAIIGVGPRGVSLIERLGAALGVAQSAHPAHSPAPIDLHLIDDQQLGAGRIWRTDQTRTLCMNTLAGAVTLFTEPGATVEGQVREGPTMYEWVLLALDAARRAGIAATGSATSADPFASADAAVGFAAHAHDAGGAGTASLAQSTHALQREQLAQIAEAHRRVWVEHPADLTALSPVLDEMARTRPESNPTRALYGEYIRWCLGVALAWLPGNVQVHRHHARVVGLVAADAGDDAGADADVLTLSDGERIRATATVIAGGWLRNAPTVEEAALREATHRHPELTWIAPDNPIDQPLETVPAGETALVRGTGMGFFDAMALLTIERGGRFDVTPETRSGLTYRPSGAEPKLVVSSTRGYPFLPKSEYHSLPPKADLHRLGAVVRRLESEAAAETQSDRLIGSIDFDAEVWPAIVRDAYEAHARTLARVRPGALLVDLTEITQLIDTTPAEFAALDAALAPVIPAEADRFHPDRLIAPLADATQVDQGDVASAVEALTQLIGDRLVGDLHEAGLGLDSPIKAGLWAFSAARKPSSVLGRGGRFTWESRCGRYHDLMSFGGMIGSGPPAFRSRQLLALIDAGLVHFVGAHPALTIDDGHDEPGPAFELRSPTTGGRPLRARTLIDAWMHSPDVRISADPLLAGLRADARVRPHELRRADGTRLAGVAPEVDVATGLVVHADGALDARVHVAGIPLNELLGDAVISPMPGTDPTMLRETDRVARSLVAQGL